MSVILRNEVTKNLMNYADSSPRSECQYYHFRQPHAIANKTLFYYREKATFNLIEKELLQKPWRSKTVVIERTKDDKKPAKTTGMLP
ncbi:MAG: hypothetical protein D6748_15010 [Calditrichaeota bacterium]|nr:MAG: hypothetical protein D6748_15010 [Calditrichota bacterium]